MSIKQFFRMRRNSRYSSDVLFQTWCGFHMTVHPLGV